MIKPGEILVRFGLRTLTLAALCISACGQSSTYSDDGQGESDGQGAAAAITQHYSPYAERDYPTNVYFGDTHHHTANSGDAFAAGNRITPEQAYRLARGEEVVSSSGVPVRLSRPMDFLVISDHAEAMGVMYGVYDGNPVFMNDEVLKRWNAAMHEGGQAAKDVMTEIIVRQGDGTLPEPLMDPEISAPIVKSVWEAYTETATQFNEPGQFTAMIAYEWTSVPGGDNLHRNVLFRGDKDKADQMMPFTSWQSEDPEKLWEWMAAYEEKTGGQVLAIPHNGNLSNGRMFALVDFEGNPLTRDYAERRARWEILQEVMQTKGSSETHPSLSPTDEFADFGIAGWEYGNLTLTGSPETPEMRPYMYLRAALQQGMKLEQELGVNPFKFGFIGGTDVHNGLTSIEEDNFFGKHVSQEPKPDRWSEVAKEGLGKIRYTWHYTGAGYAAVWARENTRSELWDAMMRKEVYATSGSRMTVRFFGAWNFTEEDAVARNIAGIGYAKGVPMGGDFAAQTDTSASPTFLVSAMKDPLFGNLDRVQIIKGWLDAEGELHEKIYDVAWGDADKRTINGEGRLTPVGNTVDVANATWSDTIGDPMLQTVWEDPDFDAAQSAFYYARVLEIPTPHWTVYDRKRFGIEMSDEVPDFHQERAWTSPIWYTP